MWFPPNARELTGNGDHIFSLQLSANDISIMSNHYIYSKISGNSRTTGLFHTCPMNCVGNEFMPDACAIMLNVPVLYLLSVPLTFVINM